MKVNNDKSSIFFQIKTYTLSTYLDYNFFFFFFFLKKKKKIKFLKFFFKVYTLGHERGGDIGVRILTNFPFAPI